MEGPSTNLIRPRAWARGYGSRLRKEVDSRQSRHEEITDTSPKAVPFQSVP